MRFFSGAFFWAVILLYLPAAVLWNIAKYVANLKNSPRLRSETKVIQDFGRFLSEQAPEAGTKFYDLKKLPYSKPRIKEALLAGVASAYKNADIQNLNALESTLLVTLPHFQSGVGRKPIFSGQEDLVETDETNLLYLWYLKKVKPENIGFLEMNYKIESNNSSELIKNVKQQIDNKQ